MRDGSCHWADDTINRERRRSGGAEARSLCFFPDGNQVAYIRQIGGYNQIFTVDVKVKKAHKMRCPRNHLAQLSALLVIISSEKGSAAETGLASKYVNDAGIEKDPAVLFSENFESGTLTKWEQVRGDIKVTETNAHGGRYCVELPMERGKNTAVTPLNGLCRGQTPCMPGCIVKFSADYQYCHHFVWLGANERTNKWSAFGKAGLKPDGTYYSTGMEPWFAWGKNPPPGEVNLYTYYLDMEPDKKMNKYWGNGFFPPGPGKGEAAGPERVGSAPE